MKITSLMTGRSLGEELLDLENGQKVLLKRCRELEAASVGTLFEKETAPAARWKNENGVSCSFSPQICCFHRFKNPLTAKTVTRKLGPRDEALKERIKLSLLCKKMIPVLEYNIEKLEGLRKIVRDPELSELEAKLPPVYKEIRSAEEAFRESVEK